VLNVPNEKVLADRRVIPQFDGLLITLGGGETVTEALANAKREPFSEPAEAPTKPTDVAVEPPKATRLVSIEVLDDEEGALVRLRAHGALVNRNRFILSDPDRLVIDFPGLKSDAAPRVEGSGLYVDRVRVGENEKRVRVVIDAPNEAALVGRQVTTAPDGLLVTLGRPPLRVATPTPGSAPPP
jgi:hypothetical protein